MALDFSIGTARTPLNIQGGISNYYMAQKNKRANLATEAAQSKDREAKKALELDRQLVQKHTKDGKFNGDGMVSELMSMGMLKKANEVKNELNEQKETIYKLKTTAMDQRQALDRELGQSFKAVLESSNPVKSFLFAKENAARAGMQLSEGLMNYFPTQEEIEDGRLNPNVAQELASFAYPSRVHGELHQFRDGLVSSGEKNRKSTLRRTRS